MATLNAMKGVKKRAPRERAQRNLVKPKEKPANKFLLNDPYAYFLGKSAEDIDEDMTNMFYTKPGQQTAYRRSAKSKSSGPVKPSSKVLHQRKIHRLRRRF